MQIPTGYSAFVHSVVGCQESVAEMTRCVEMDTAGSTSARLRKARLSGLRDKHWDPILSAAQEMQLPVSFHHRVRKPHC